MLLILHWLEFAFIHISKNDSFLFLPLDATFGRIPSTFRHNATTPIDEAFAGRARVRREDVL